MQPTISTSMLSVNEVINNPHVQGFLAEFGWNMDPKINQSGVSFYNANSSAAIIFSQNSIQLVKIMIQAEPGGVLLDNEKMISSLGLAVNYIKRISEEFANYGQYENNI
jgi:hypothetical protein